MATPTDMPPIAEPELKELRNLVLSLREEVRVGFVESKANIDAKFAEVNLAISKLSGDIRVLEERTKLGFWGFVGRAVIISILGALALAALSFALYDPAKIKL
jgi:hypothetical protein